MCLCTTHLVYRAWDVLTVAMAQQEHQYLLQLSRPPCNRSMLHARLAEACVCVCVSSSWVDCSYRTPVVLGELIADVLPPGT